MSSFDSLDLFKIGEGKRRHEFVEWRVEWHVEWHNLCEIRYLRNDLKNKLTEERVLFSRQFYKSASFFMLRTLSQYLNI